MDRSGPLEDHLRISLGLDLQFEPLLIKVLNLLAKLWADVTTPCAEGLNLPSDTLAVFPPIELGYRL